MGTDKRDRQKANKAAKLEAERLAEAKARRNQTIRTVVIAGVLIVAVFLLVNVLTGCSSSASDGAAETTSTTAAASSGAKACTTSDTGKAVIDYDKAPTFEIDPAKTYTATVKTTEGTVVLELDTKRTPDTTANFIALSRNCYFDGTDLFRTEANTGIIQGGSPHTQDNSDQGPGYTIADEGGPFSSADYAPGTIAMANTGQPNSGSAQFFFLANEGGAYLGDTAQLGSSAGTYTVFGKTTEGLDVLQKIAALDSGDGQGTPSKQVTIESVTVKES
ncbi:peptidylprolyl isomerase [Aquihabitans sp. McL0605]|uniref:peptidylprolyl isomerase n=1 Tax=Aquihabitans sp. McL0605 TaxID=3415671 RepID=UPI003CEBA812